VSRSTPGFDRVRPREPRAGGIGPEIGVDAQGKRALFSRAPEVASPGLGSVLVECSRCDERTVLGLNQALRQALPSVHFAVRVGHGSTVHGISMFKRDYASFMRCPACGRPSWVRFTLQL
jgi:hypothetical protein